MHFLILLILVVPYFIPTIVAILRKKRNAAAIAALNFFLGWSVVGWVAALIWALAEDTPTVAITNTTVYPPAPVPTQVQAQPTFCQSCGGRLNSGARFCPSCGKAIP